MEHNAYDYDAQRWIDGEPARLLLLQQCRDELALVEGPDGSAYCAWSGTDQRASAEGDAARVAETASALRAAIADLSAK